MTDLTAHAKAVERLQAAEKAGDLLGAQVAEDDLRRIVSGEPDLQGAIDRAYWALRASEMVGGPTERDAWLTALEALGPVATHHTQPGTTR